MGGFSLEVHSQDIIAGYDVYRDNNKLATVTETNYFDTNIAEGEHTYGIVAKYANGEDAEAATINIDFTAKTEALQAVENVKKGYSLVIFPEGTRNKTNFRRRFSCV